ncbi:MAG: hypothetical protein L3J97_06115 [Thermoplasmata archaeon]|nr:hypothetical protein [Thermoplasmata archaeon]
MARFVLELPIHAPPGFVYRWCTDFRDDDPDLTEGGFERRITARSSRRIVFEDLEPRPRGWAWAQAVIALHPPYRWNLTLTGNVQRIHAQYRLTPEPPGSSVLTMNFDVRRGVRERSARVETRRSVQNYWQHLVPQIERDWLATAVSKRARIRRRRGR